MCVNHIYGAGSQTSRLYTRGAREARARLWIRTSLNWMDHANIVSGGTATRSDRAAETLSVIDEETQRMAAEGPTQDELDKAKAYLKGSYALAFDTSAKIAGQLVQIQLDKLGIDYPETAQCADRRGDARGRQARGEAPARHQDADRGGRPRPGADQVELALSAGMELFCRNVVMVRDAFTRTLTARARRRSAPTASPRAALDDALTRGEARSTWLREAHANASLPLLRLPAKTDDLDEVRNAAARLRAGATDVVVLGTGGSSLGGQTWRSSPASACAGSRRSGRPAHALHG